VHAKRAAIDLEIPAPVSVCASPRPGRARSPTIGPIWVILQEFHDAGVLNAPWGMAIAPADLGRFGGGLLAGNFGDGAIAAFDPSSRKFIDTLRDAAGKAISIDGVWGLTFGNGVSLGDFHALYFTAGPNKEFDGLFGKPAY
jgi:uncharacterized protein (TIGR03118 family)